MTFCKALANVASIMLMVAFCQRNKYNTGQIFGFKYYLTLFKVNYTQYILVNIWLF